MPRKLSAVIELAGFRAAPLEFWGRGDGAFYARPWRVADGPVARSAQNDKRNRIVPLTYTSLIVDAVKTNNHDPVCLRPPSSPGSPGTTPLARS